MSKLKQQAALEGIVSLRPVWQASAKPETYFSQCEKCGAAVIGSSEEGMSMWQNLHLMEATHAGATWSPVCLLPTTWATRSWFEI